MRRGRTLWIGVGAALATCVPAAACSDAFTDGSSADGGAADALTAADAMPDNDVPDHTIGTDGGGHADGGASDAPQDHSLQSDTFSQPDTFVGPDACETAIPSDTTAVFVATNGGGTTCSKASPCSSINTALNAAKSAGKQFVYVALGTYTELVTLVANVTVQGGWLRSWTRDCSPTAYADVIIQPGAGAVVATVVAANVAGAALDTLTITSRQTPGANVDESIYGILAQTTTLTMNNVYVSVISAGGGTDGQAGQSGTNASGTCAISSASNGGSGTAATHGAGAPAGLSALLAGLFSQRGGSPSTSATNGNNGTYTASTCSATVLGGCNVAPFDCDATPNGTLCGAEGAPGCAGGAGSNGTPGYGGGSSIALYVVDAHVTVTGGSLQSGNGGSGGRGGAAGASGNGTSGTTGNNQSVTKTCTGTPPNNTCNNVIVKGGIGGLGGNGGAGGSAGGGAGGYSFSYFVRGSGLVTASGTQFVHGNGGTGGAGGAGASNKGADGVGADHN